MQGITKTTITLGELADVSGPIPGLFAGAVDGMDAWAAQVNSTGGIDGRKVVIDHKDSALSCSLYASGLESLSASVFANVGTYSLVDECGEATLKADPTFPDIEGAVLNPSITSYPNVFGAIPAVNGFATTGYQWVKDKYGLSAVQHTADLWGQSLKFDFDVQRAAAETIGYNYVYNRGYAPTETDYTSDILRMKADGVKVVDLYNMAVQHLAGFLRQAAQQDFHPDAIINASGYDSTLFTLLGHATDAASLVLPLPYATYLDSDAGTLSEITTMTTWLHRTHPGDPMNLSVMESYAAGLLFGQALSTLGADPSQSQLLSSIRSITSFRADGLLTASNVGQKKGAYCVVIVRTRGDKFVRVDPPSGFECNGSFFYAST